MSPLETKGKIGLFFTV